MKVGEIRAIQVPERGQSYVAILRLSEENEIGEWAQVMVIGDDEMCAGYNDIILYEDERPMPLSSVLQVFMNTGIPVNELGEVYATLRQETITLVNKMHNFSGRDLARAGFHPDDKHPMRQEFLHEQFEICYWATAMVFSELDRLEQLEENSYE